MIKPKYPSLAELKAQGYPGAAKIQQDRRVVLRSQKLARESAKRLRESAALSAYMDHVNDLMVRDDRAGVEHALLNANKYLKVK